MTEASSFADDRALAIVNPIAGRGAGERLAKRMAADFRAQGVRVDIVRTPAPDEAARLAREAAADGYRFIVSAGGDGTANEVANGIVGSGAVLALYPIGSGNDFARALGYPRKRSKLPPFLADAQPRRIDVGEVNGRIFLNAAGVGIDGHVAERIVASTRVVGPTLGYFVGALVSIATYRPRPMRVTIDGTVRTGRHLVVVAANGTHFGSGMRIAPQASLDDGQLDVVLAGDLSPWASMVALGKIYFGTHIDGKTIILKRARAVEIELERPLAAQLDGEVTTVPRLSIRVRLRALEVLAR